MDKVTTRRRATSASGVGGVSGQSIGSVSSTLRNLTSQPSQMPARELEVPRELTNLDCSLATLGDRLSELRERLNPALSSAPDYKNESEDKDTSEGITQLGHRVVCINDKVVSYTYLINDLLARLEL